MSISVNCPSCRSPQTLSESLAGRRVACPLCGTPVDVPETEHNPYAAPSTSLESEGVSLVVPGSLFGKFGLTIELFAANLPLITLIILTVWLPGNLILAAIAANSPPGLMTTVKLNNFIEGIFGPICAGGLVHLISKRMRGERTTYPEAIAVGLRNWGRVFWARLVAGLLVLLGMIAFIVPGVILQLRYLLLDPVVILEGANPSEARRRSTRLTEGKKGTIFVAGLLFFIPFFALSFGAGFAASFFEMDENPWVGLVADCILDIVSAFVTILLFLFYWEARFQEKAAEAEVEFL